ncbi:MAG: bestrophin family protein [Pirellulaceae bacterium]
MYTRRSVRLGLLAQFAWWIVLVSGVWSALVVLCFLWLAEYGFDCSLPIAPLGTIGIAVAFYVGFKNSQAYDRFWEARKIWGGIVNVSRSWANQVISFISSHHAPEPVDESDVKQIHRSMIYRHIAWLQALRYQLRRQTAWSFVPKRAAKKFMQETDVEAMRKQISELLSTEEQDIICSQANSATQLLRWQSEELKQVVEQHKLTEEFRLMGMMDLITEMYTLQGKCERIKNTPFPRQYAHFSAIFVFIFVLLLPFGIVGQLASRGVPMIWMTVPVSVIISWIFWSMENVGDSSEDPFENFINDVPMTALCRTIEIDLRQMLGETDVPPALQPENDILM